MLFSSGIFLFWFLPITVAIYYLLPHRILKNSWLFFVSIFFYGYGEPLFVLLMLSSIGFNYLMGLGIYCFQSSKKKQRLILLFMVIGNLSLFYVFKYLDFSILNVNALLGTSYPLKKITLPIGISFFTFQAMSYVLDIYRNPKENPVQKNPFLVGLYVSLFPQLIAGPIVRYETVAKEMKERHENWSDFSEGTVRFLVGFLKKVLLANNMAIIADVAFSSPTSDLGMSFAGLGAICYTLHISFDFSGYSDMAIGLGKIFGFHFLENFNYPYAATSITDFWRRWHISLSSWFRDYVYIPLGGNRVGKTRQFVNLFVVWLLTGIWHGANWTFILWGMYYFVWLSFEKFLLPKEWKQKLERSIFGHLYVMVLVTVGWVIFRADTLSYAMEYLGAMFSLGTSEIVPARSLFYVREYGLAFVMSIVASVPLFPLLEQWTEIRNWKLQLGYHGVVMVAITVLFYGAVVYIIKGSYNPFIYFNF